jgi:GH35 family endo-1,4-beta-xylanase
MLSFTVHSTEEGTAPLKLDGAYVVGSDGVPLRAELEVRNSRVYCAKRADGPAGLALVWPVPGSGALLLETSRLMDREKPYNLVLELVRGRLMHINQKREDWGLFDFDGVEPVTSEIDKARDLMVQALKTEDALQQSMVASEALKLAMVAGERLSLFHADIFLNRRKQAHAFSRRTLGCAVDLSNTSEAYRHRLRECFDYAYLPMPWRSVEPKQQEYTWQAFDAWVEWLVKNRMPIKVGPLVSFNEGQIPDWLAIYETDFEAVRNFIFEHVRRVVERYGSYVHQWDVISGIHADNTFQFTFEQLMEVTRITASLVKQLAPRAQTVINLVAPWGEYYARNQRTIPPMLYADMVVQSGVAFDGLGVQLLFGKPTDGMFTRDMFQISERLDKLGNLGKPLHITTVQVPSAPTANGDQWYGGFWREPWSEPVQAQWVKEFYGIALSKPFVESITWADLADRPETGILPTGGLLSADLHPKLAFKVLKQYRAELLNAVRRPPVRRRDEIK